MITLPLLILMVVVLFFFCRWFLGIGVGAPFVPLHHRDVEDGINLAQVTANDVVVDLGSGDGRILIAAAKRGATVIGYEINPLLVWWSRFRLRRFKNRTHIYCGNLLQADLSQASVIFIFGLGPIMPRVVELIRPHAHPRLRVVSFAFSLPGVPLLAQKGIAKLYDFKIHDSSSVGVDG